MWDDTQFSRDATSTNGTKLWDPSEVLGIINEDYGYSITCVGHAPSKRRRCQIGLSGANRNFITEKLNEIAYLSPDSPAVMSKLRAIAGPALCVRYHQGQAQTILMQWQRKIQQMRLYVEDQKPTSPVQSSKRESARDQEIEEMRDELRELREFVAQCRAEASYRRYQDQRRQEPDVKDENEEFQYRSSEESARKARKLERERLEKARLERERLERERLEKERLEKERLEKERLEKERLEKEKQDQEEKLRQERERAARNERIRQKAQKLREEREREKREKEQKEREEWDQLWTKYQKQWMDFRTSANKGGNIKETVPWPVKSGLYRDLNASNVKEFFEKAVSSDAHMAKLMRKECQKWHPESWLRRSQLGQVDQIIFDMICRVVTGLLNDSAGKSADFLD